MSDTIDNIEILINQIKNSQTLRDDCLNLSDSVYEGICYIIIHNHEQSKKENAIRMIDLLIQSGRKASDRCLNAHFNCITRSTIEIIKKICIKNSLYYHSTRE